MTKTFEITVPDEVLEEDGVELDASTITDALNGDFSFSDGSAIEVKEMK